MTGKGWGGRTWHGYQSFPLQSAIIAQQELPEQDKAGGYKTGYAPRRHPRQLGRRPPHSSCRRCTGSDGAALTGKHVAGGQDVRALGADEAGVTCRCRRNPPSICRAVLLLRRITGRGGVRRWLDVQGDGAASTAF